MVYGFFLACGDVPQTEEVIEPQQKFSSLDSEIDQGNILVRVQVTPDRVRLGDAIELTLIVQSIPTIDVEMPPFGEALGRLSISDFKPRESLIQSDRFAMEYRQGYGLQPNRVEQS